MHKIQLLFVIINVVLQINCNHMEDKIFTQSTLAIKWTSTNFQAADVGTGAEGDTYVVGLDGKLYLYNILANTYTVVQGDREIPHISKLDVDAEGTPYVISQCGRQIFYLNCENKWIQLPGCANDIGVGRGPEVWKVGCDARSGGFGVWKLFCKCDCKCNCTRSCTRFRPASYSQTTKESKNCYWYRIEGGATRIDVDINGNPWTVSNDHLVSHYDGVNWNLIHGYLAEDISVSNDNVVFVAGFNSNVARLICEDLGTWQVLGGSAKSITAGPFSLPYMVDNSNLVLTTAIKSINTLS